MRRAELGDTLRAARFTTREAPPMTSVRIAAAHYAAAQLRTSRLHLVEQCRQKSTVLLLQCIDDVALINDAR